MQRGEIWWATLPEPSGSGPAGRRPVLVIQADTFTQSRIATVIVLVITSNVALALAPGNVFLPRKISRLTKDSVVNVSQILTLDKRFVTERVGPLPHDLMEQIEAGIRLVLSL